MNLKGYRLRSNDRGSVKRDGALGYRYSDMNSMEKSMLLDELFVLRKADKEREAKHLNKLGSMTEQLLALNENSLRLLRQNDKLKQMLFDRDVLIKNSRRECRLEGTKKLLDKNRFDGKTQKLSPRSRGSDSREVDKEDFDGSSTPGLPSEETGTDLPSSAGMKQEWPYCLGMSYKRMKADKSYVMISISVVYRKSFHHQDLPQVFLRASKLRSGA